MRPKTTLHGRRQISLPLDLEQPPTIPAFDETTHEAVVAVLARLLLEAAPSFAREVADEPS